MCGCSKIGTGGTPPMQFAPPTAPVGLSSYISPGQLPTQTNVNDTRVRNPALAERSMARLRAATQHLQTPEQARAAGYVPNPSAPDHYIHNGIFAERNGFDLERPATLMYEKGKLVGVMLSHDPRKGAPPDLGAGSWHTHGGTAGAEYAEHVWFNKPLQSAFGNEIGDV